METKNIKTFSLLIGGELRYAKGKAQLEALDPSIGKVFAHLSDASVEDMEDAINLAFDAYKKGEWRKMSVAQRGGFLKKMADLIRTHAKELAELECRDVGKTIKHTTFIDVPACASTFEYYGNLGEEIFSKKLSIDAPVESQVFHEPMGVVGCIIPWNYPLIMTAWKLAPALLAGNCVILKPSSVACVSVMRLAELFVEAGFPKGVVSIVSGKSREMAGCLIESPKVAMLSFTGGTDTGHEIMKRAAQTNKKLTLELGGKSPNIVFADCDKEAALGGTLAAIFLNQGQMCTAGSRLLLEDTIYNEFLNGLITKTKNLKIGIANRYDTDFGPLVSEKRRRAVLQFIEKGKEEGASLICGGSIPKDSELSEGFYIEPTIFSNVDNKMAIAQEEIFGPVLSVIRFKTEEEAIALANDTRYGLAAMVWTQDEEKMQRVASQLECGTVWINTYGGFYNEAPYGGMKQSGFGRELGIEGLLEYTQTKHICKDTTPGGKSLVCSWF